MAFRADLTRNFTKIVSLGECFHKISNLTSCDKKKKKNPLQKWFQPRSDAIDPDKRDIHGNICCRYSLEVPHYGTSNEYHNICFHIEIRKISLCFG